MKIKRTAFLFTENNKKMPNSLLPTTQNKQRHLNKNKFIKNTSKFSKKGQEFNQNSNKNFSIMNNDRSRVPSNKTSFNSGYKHKKSFRKMNSTKPGLLPTPNI